MAIGYEFFDKRTDKLIEGLREDDALADGLDEPVNILKGPPRFTGSPFAVFVDFGALEDAEYTIGGDLVATDVGYNITWMTRLGGNPEALSAAHARLAANIFRNVCEHRQEAGYWLTATPGRSRSVVLPDEKQQNHRIETMRVAVQFDDETI